MWGRKRGGGWHRAAAYAALAGFLFHIALELTGAFMTCPLHAAAGVGGMHPLKQSGNPLASADPQQRAQPPQSAHPGHTHQEHALADGVDGAHRHHNHDDAYSVHHSVHGEAHLQGTIVLLCTAEGLKRFVLDSEGQPLGGLGPDPHDICPICSAHAAVFTLLAPQILPFPGRRRLLAALRPSCVSKLPRACTAHAYLSRAPPPPLTA